jgi:hypothetical protein
MVVTVRVGRGIGARAGIARVRAEAAAASDCAFRFALYAVESAARPVIKPVPTRAAAVRPPVSTDREFSVTSRDVVERGIDVLQKIERCHRGASDDKAASGRR